MSRSVPRSSTRRRGAWPALAGAVVLLASAAVPRPAPAAVPVATSVLGWSPGVAQEVPLGSSLTVYFNRPMDAAGVERAWSIAPRIGGSFHAAGTGVSFTPSRPLRPHTRYRVTIGASARALDGIQLGHAFSLSFVTGDALRILSYSPGNGTAGVPAFGRVSITFNHPMVPLQGLSAPPPAPRGWAVSIVPRVAGYGSWLGTSTWVFHPYVGLQPSTRYVVSLSGAVRDAVGETLGHGLRWSFETAKPEVFSRAPHNGAQYVDPRATVSVTFDQPMDHASTVRAFSVTQSDAAVRGSFSWRGTTLTFHPSAPLGSESPYQVRIAPSARSLNGRGHLSHGVSWHFSAAPPPRVMGSSPGSGKTAYASSPAPYSYRFVCCYAYEVQIFFSTPMSKKSLDSHLSISPSVGRFDTQLGGPDQLGRFSYVIAGDFAPSSVYGVHIAAGVKDAFGRPLPAAYTLAFKTSRLFPSVALLGMPNEQGISFSAGQVFKAPLQVVNVPSVHVELLKTNLWGLDGTGRVTGTVVRHWTQALSPPVNHVTNTTLSLATKAGTPLPPGLYWLDVKAPDSVPGWPAFVNGPPESTELVLVTNAGITMKRGSNGTLVWVTEKQDGKPLAGVTVRMTNSIGKTIVSGKTDAHGLHFFRSGGSNAFAAVANDGVHYGMTEAYWNPNASSPAFLPAFWWPGGYSPGASGTYLYTDRPIYRPGQRVYFRGLMWRDTDAVYSSLGPRLARVQVTDTQGRNLYHTSVRLDRFGAIHGSFVLPSKASTGDGNIYVSAGPSLGVSTQFTVAEYRKPGFLTMLKPARASYAQGQTVSATATVRYVFGAPVTHQQLSWVAYEQPQYPQPPGWDSYSFFNWEDVWQKTMGRNPIGAYGIGGPLGTQIAHGTGRTDGNGRLTIRLPVNLAKALTDQSITLEATATDVNHQSVSGRAVVAAHRADLAIGLRTDHEVRPAGQPQTVSIAAVKPDGKPAPNLTLAVTVSRRTYTSKLVDIGNRQTGWHAVPHDTPVEMQTIRTNAHGTATVTFTPKDGGEYRVSVQAKDELGNTAANAISVYASAEGFSDWGATADTSINLKPDRTTYSVGETAHILVPAPFAGATALVTVERGSIRRYRVTHFATNSPTISVPITMDCLPNVFVTVTLERGWNGTSPPEWRYGTAELHVRVNPKHLVVRLQQNGYRHHPRDPVTYTVVTTDGSGKPVSAQLSLALVDTAVLALHDETNANILQALYAERPLGVTTASDGVLSVDHLQQSPDFQVQSIGSKQAAHGVAAVNAPARLAGGGGGGPQAPTIVRSQFADTAYWTGAMVTNAAGRATVHLTLPDNATTWRLDARGVTVDAAVGQARIQTLATQDLVLRPALPRFFEQGDRLTVGAALNNNLARPVRVTVALSAKGLRLPPHAARSFVVAAHGERYAGWPVGVPVDNSAVVVVRAVTSTPGVRGDAVQLTIPVYPPLTDETVATSGQVYGSMRQMIVVPRGAVPVPGALTVRVSSSLTAGLGAAYGGLRPQAGESNDDVAGRVLAAVALHSIPQSITGLSRPAYRRLPEDVAAGVQKLIDSQLGDGGWPWFTDPYVFMSDPYVTADAVQAIAASNPHGLAWQALVRGQRYLRQQLGQSPQLDASVRAHLLFVLAASGSPSTDAAESLYADSIRRLHLDPTSLSDLGAALAFSRDLKKARTIVADLDTSAKVSTTGAHWESDGVGVYTGSAVAGTIGVLSMLLAHSPHDPLVPAAVRWLMFVRDGSSWDCSHDSAQAIAVLAAFARAAREGTADYAYTVALDGTTKVTGRYSRANQTGTSMMKVRVSQMRRSGPTRLDVFRSGPDGTVGTGPLYYLTRLHYFLPARSIAARSEGISISRRYLDLGDRPISRVAPGSPIRVELTVHTDGTLMYLNIQDPIPGGTEPIDESLNTSQQGLFGAPPSRIFPTTQDLSWYLMHADLHDNRVSLYAFSLPPGTYRYTYLLQATVPGRYGVAPAHAAETFFPEVFGRSAGQELTIG